MFTVGIADKDNNFISNLVSLIARSQLKIKSIDFNKKNNIINKIIYHDKMHKTDITLLKLNNKSTVNDLILDSVIYIFPQELNTLNNLDYEYRLNFRKQYQIINIDNYNSDNNIIKNDCYIISCGLNPKATITASSIDDNDNSILACQQRSIFNIFDQEIEPQEITISLNSINKNEIFDGLKIAAAGLILGIEKFVFTKKLLFANSGVNS